MQTQPKLRKVNATSGFVRTDTAWPLLARGQCGHILEALQGCTARAEQITDPAPSSFFREIGKFNTQDFSNLS